MSTAYSPFHRNMVRFNKDKGMDDEESPSLLADVYSFSVYEPTKEPTDWQKQDIINHLVMYWTA